MKRKGLSKSIFFLVVPAFLVVGGAAAFLYAVHDAGDPLVEADIDAHFASIESQADRQDAPGTAETTDSPPFIETTTGERGEKNTRKKKNRGEKTPRREPRSSQKRPHQLKPAAEIRKIAPNTWLVSNAILEKARKKPLQYVKNAFAELVMEEGRPVGFRLKKIAKGSPVYQIGLRNRDILTAINGHPLNSIENVTLALASFQNATQFRLDLIRRDKKRSFYYKLVD